MAIVKILARHSPSYSSLIHYILSESKTAKDQVFTQNLRPGTVEDYVRGFVENEAFRRGQRSDQTYLFHEIVSFNSVEDGAVMTDAVLGDLAREYMRLRGDTGVMLGAVHRDKKHVHMHFCVSALHFRTGKSFGLSKGGLLDRKTRFQEYHLLRYPEIDMSDPEHGKGDPYQRDGTRWAIRRELLAGEVGKCFAKAKTQREFLELLRDGGLDYYERGGRAAGIERDGSRVSFERLLGGERLEALPAGREEEDRTLEEIRRIRERQRGRDRTFDDYGDRAR